MVELQTFVDLLTPLSITCGIIYYVMVLRNQNKTRQIQLLMQLSDNYTEEHSQKTLKLLGMEFKDYADFEHKYGSDNNPENFAMRMTSWNRFNTQGMLLKNGLVTSDLLFGSGRTAPMWHWKKFGDVIKEIRNRYATPLYCNGFEYLAKENKKYLENQGHRIELQDTYYQYIPEDQ